MTRVRVLQGWLSMIPVLQGGLEVAVSTSESRGTPAERNNSNFSQAPAACPQRSRSWSLPPRPPAAAPGTDPAPHSQPGKGPWEVLGRQGGMQRAGGVRGGAGALCWSQVDIGDIRGGARGLAAPVRRRLGAEFLLGLGCLLQALG